MLVLLALSQALFAPRSRAAVKIQTTLPERIVETGVPTSFTVTLSNTSKRLVVLMRLDHGGGSVLFEDFNLLPPGRRRVVSLDALVLPPGSRKVVLTLHYGLPRRAVLRRRLRRVKNYTKSGPRYERVTRIPRLGEGRWLLDLDGLRPRMKVHEVRHEATIEVAVDPVIERHRRRWRISGYRTKLHTFGRALRVGRKTYLVKDGREEMIGDVSLRAVTSIDVSMVTARAHLVVHFPARLKKRVVRRFRRGLLAPTGGPQPELGRPIYPEESWPAIVLPKARLKTLWRFLIDEGLRLGRPHHVLTMTARPRP